VKHYQTCTNPHSLTKLNLDAVSHILQCDCCGAYVEVPTPPDPAPVFLDFSHLERRVMDHYGEEPPSLGDVYTGRLRKPRPE